MRIPRNDKIPPDLPLEKGGYGFSHFEKGGIMYSIVFRGTL